MSQELNEVTPVELTGTIVPEDEGFISTINEDKPEPVELTGTIVRDDEDVPYEVEALNKEEPLEESQSVDELIDEYGNEKPEKVTKKTYSEDEVNERINAAVRDRLSRMKNSQGQTPPVQQEGQSNQDWQKELKEFIKQTNLDLQTEQMVQKEQMQEYQIQQEFENRFHQGMAKFNDFREIVSSAKITDAMTMATRAMKNPAAFLYAAAKNQPKELERISHIVDPYSQMVEMGKLDERMRKVQGATKAARPISRSREDVTGNGPKNAEPSIDDLIKESEDIKKSKLRRKYQF